MPNRISTVATASLASALILLLLGGRGSAAPKKTTQECEIDYKVCLKSCNGPAGDLGERCRAGCDVELVNCRKVAPDKGSAKPNKAGDQSPPTSGAKPNDPKPKKGISGTQPPLKWVPNSAKKGINGTSSGTWVPNSPAKGKGVPSVPAGGTWNPSPSSGAKGPILRSSGGRR